LLHLYEQQAPAAIGYQIDLTVCRLVAPAQYAVAFRHQREGCEAF